MSAQQESHNSEQMSKDRLFACDIECDKFRFEDELDALGDDNPPRKKRLQDRLDMLNAKLANIARK